MSKQYTTLAVMVVAGLGSILHLLPGCARWLRQPQDEDMPGPVRSHNLRKERPMKAEKVAICLEKGVGEEVFGTAASALQKAYEMEVFRGPVLVVPPEALDPRRGQYLADLVLSHVPLPAQASFSLGVVQSDLYTTGLNFVFGMAQGRRALISVHRLKAGPLGHSLFLRRLAVEAVHEIGHVLGLGHCTDPACVMFFSNTLADTDRKGSELCARCKGLLRNKN